MIRVLKAGLAGFAAVLLAGCFVSERPLLDSKNARSAPLKSGAYTVCSTEEEGESCRPATVTRADDRSFIITDDGAAADQSAPARFRFRRVGRDGWLGQSDEPTTEGDAASNPMYFYVWREGEAVAMTMMWCPDVPDAILAPLLASGAVVRSHGESGCDVTSLEAIETVATAYHRGDVAPRGEVRFVRRAGP